MQPVEEVIAKVMGINAGSVTDTLAFGSIPEWDSLNHVSLMMELETVYGASVDEDKMIELSNVERIRAFISENMQS